MICTYKIYLSRLVEVRRFRLDNCQYRALTGLGFLWVRRAAKSTRNSRSLVSLDRSNLNKKKYLVG